MALAQTEVGKHPLNLAYGDPKMFVAADDTPAPLPLGHPLLPQYINQLVHVSASVTPKDPPQ